MQVNWVSCEERLPAEMDFYWVGWYGSLRRRKPIIGEWLPRVGAWYLEGHHYRPGEVLAPTYWAEVDWPDPPQTEQEKAARCPGLE